MTLPPSLAAWEQQRGHIREKLWQLLGDMPPLFTPQATIRERGERAGCSVETIVFENGAGAQVPGYFLLPQHTQPPFPAVLYLHVHGNKYEQGKEELFRERVPGIIPAQALTQAGYAVLAIDAYGFGEREKAGPAGAAESGVQVEHALYKHFIWQGMTLWGMMLRDDLLALNYLLGRPEIDPQRVAITGMSLGGSRATWIAALDDRPQVVIPVAQMTRYADFAAAGQYNLHGIYYYLPGMLKSGIDMEHIAALAAPRKQAILIGDQDPLSPLVGIEKIVSFTREIYALYGAAEQFTTFVEAGAGHQYTPAMFTQMLATLRQSLSQSG